MQPLQNVSLAAYSTMGLGGPAAWLVEVTKDSEVKAALEWATAHNLPVIMIGGGSNIVWQDSGYPGLVIVNKITGVDVYQEDDTNYYLTIGAGENWDQIVERAVDLNLTGIEALSLIPGTTGATPVQNVGAYGQEIAETLTTVRALDKTTAEFVNLANIDCQFSYRSSRFKTTDRGRFLITSITLHLTKGKPLPPFYASVDSFFKEHKISDITPAALRQAVISIRSNKLPNPATVHNCGSFFKNPLVASYKLSEMLDLYGTVPHWPSDNDMVKLSAAWLIEQAGFKDYHDAATGMATWPNQALVFINERARSTADLLNFKQKVWSAVKLKFDIELIQEPELLPD